MECRESVQPVEVQRNQNHLYEIGILYQCPCEKTKIWTNSIRGGLVGHQELIKKLLGHSNNFYQGFCNDLFCGFNLQHPIDVIKNGVEWAPDVWMDLTGCHLCQNYFGYWAGEKEPETNPPIIMQFYRNHLGDVKKLVQEIFPRENPKLAEGNPRRKQACPIHGATWTSKEQRCSECQGFGLCFDCKKAGSNKPFCYLCDRTPKKRGIKMNRNPKYPKIPPETIENIIYDLWEGLPQTEIARKYNLSQGAISVIARKHDLGTGKGSWNFLRGPITPEILEEIELDLWEGVLTQPEIAEKYKVSQSEVSRLAKKFGLGGTSWIGSGFRANPDDTLTAAGKHLTQLDDLVENVHYCETSSDTIPICDAEEGFLTSKASNINCPDCIEILESEKNVNLKKNPRIPYEVGNIYEDKEILDDPDTELTPYFVITAFREEQKEFIMRPVRSVEGKWEFAGGTFAVKLDRHGYLKGSFNRILVDRWLDMPRENPIEWGKHLKRSDLENLNRDEFEEDDEFEDEFDGEFGDEDELEINPDRDYSKWKGYGKN